MISVCFVAAVKQRTGRQTHFIHIIPVWFSFHEIANPIFLFSIDHRLPLKKPKMSQVQSLVK